MPRPRAWRRGRRGGRPRSADRRPPRSFLQHCWRSGRRGSPIVGNPSSCEPEMPNEMYPTPNSTRGRKGHTPQLIVIHTTVGTFASTVHWFGTKESGVSAHYLVDRDGRIAQFVDETD